MEVPESMFLEKFQSTPSTRRETQAFQSNSGSYSISIHSLHTEGDGSASVIVVRRFIISIHSLHTEGDP